MNTELKKFIAVKNGWSTKQKKQTGSLVFEYCGGVQVIVENKPFAILQKLKKDLSLESSYKGGVLRIKY